ncbi:MAG TPA: hypothetical protein VK424_08120 [Thermoplasmata archaeon]|nr:hypothetical protein [Thermoplasmata archaeon]
MGTPTSTSPPSRPIVAFFRRHPILLLLAFTPGIPEYLSGSSSLELVVVSPVVFLLFLGLNLGLYGPGVLLVREAHVRWKKGWSTLLLLGGAYGLLEEGTALSTLFDPKAAVVGGLGTYGHAYGVSWVWLIGILGVHAVFSVGVPILLLGLALPETRGQPFLTGRKLPIAVAIYAIDIVLLELIVHYWVGVPLQILAAVAAGLLWIVAWCLPPDLLDPPSPAPRRGPRLFFVYGVVYFVLLVLVPGIIGELHLPAYVAFGADAAALLLLFLAVRRDIGRSANYSQLVVLAFGLVLPLMAIGLIAQLFVPIVLVPDGLAVFFFLTLWRYYRPRPGPRTVSPPPAQVT